MNRQSNHHQTLEHHHKIFVIFGSRQRLILRQPRKKQSSLQIPAIIRSRLLSQNCSLQLQKQAQLAKEQNENKIFAENFQKNVNFSGFLESRGMVTLFQDLCSTDNKTCLQQVSIFVEQGCLNKKNYRVMKRLLPCHLYNTKI